MFTVSQLIFFVHNAYSSIQRHIAFRVPSAPVADYVICAGHEFIEPMPGANTKMMPAWLAL